MRISGLSFSLAVLLLSPSASVAQVDSSSPNYRELGLTLEAETGSILQDLKITKIETRGATTKQTSMKARYRQAYSYEDTAFRIKKSLIDFTLTDADGTVYDSKSQKGPEAEILQMIIGGFGEITYLADDSLSPQRIEDWDNLKAKSKAILVKAAEISAEPSSSIKVEAIADQLFGKLTPEQAAELFLKVDKQIALPHMMGLELNKPLRAESQIQSPLGGPPLEALEVIILTHWDEAKQTARLSYDYSPTPESFTKFITEFVPTFLKNAGAPDTTIAEFNALLKQGKASELFANNTHCEYEMDITTGLVRHGKCTETVSMSIAGENAKNIQIREFSEKIKS
ncbi:hypothetical protein Q1W73_08005 [Asticcacaulis sp. ZE23SCel15]|uniref:hypothetical protein n=1 Tax=Asticcacaulis sp. ZE23SCel15 TaxID=3059027 RepID=UPI00265FB15B|nr:hypothetical protein [Asticcacaulis sp. ZE23SCel15]WKL58919.1 hypothetical protein Q1W73_08005 [Asticcacaulis sp. ZE23SCel15]